MSSHVQRSRFGARNGAGKALLLQLLCLSIVRSVWADGKNCFCKINLKPLGQNDSIHAPYDRGSVEIVGGWKACGAEKSTCACPKKGKIAYGVQNTNLWVIKNVVHLRQRSKHPKISSLNGGEEQGVPCTLWNFKNDPSPGQPKVCMCGTPDASNNRVIDADKKSWPFVRCEDRASPLCSSSLRNVPPPCGRNLNLVTTDNLNRLRDADPNDCGVSFQTNGVVTYAFRPNATIKPSIRFEVCEGVGRSDQSTDCNCTRNCDWSVDWGTHHHAKYAYIVR